MNNNLTQGGNYAILPAHIRYDKNLTDSEKLLFCELTALSNVQGYCYAGNKYLSEIYGVTKETISRRVGRLEKKGYVRVVLIRKGKEITGRHIYPLMDSSTPIDANVNTPIDITVKTPIDANVKENNLSLNKLNENNLKRKDDDKYVIEIRSIIEFYENNGFGQSSPHFFESVQKWMEEGFDSQVIIKALKIAVESNRRDIKYLNGIFKNWRARNTKTLASVEAEEKAWNSRKQNSNKTKGIPNPHVYDDDLPF